MQGGSSRRVVVAAPTLAAAANPPSTCQTSSRSKKCEYRLEVQVDKVRAGPVQKTSPVGRGRVVSALVLDCSGGAARTWCIMVHQLGVPDPSMPHVKSLYPPTCPVTRVVMGAGPQQRRSGSVTGSGLCAGNGRFRHLPAVARRGLERRPRNRAGKRRAHARKHEKLGGWASYGLRQCVVHPNTQKTITGSIFWTILGSHKTRTPISVPPKTWPNPGLCLAVTDQAQPPNIRGRRALYCR